MLKKPDVLFLIFCPVPSYAFLLNLSKSEFSCLGFSIDQKKPLKQGCFDGVEPFHISLLQSKQLYEVCFLLDYTAGTRDLSA